MADELRFGVIGLGRAGSAMLSAMLRHPGIRVTAAADPIEEHRRRFAVEVEGETYASAQELCDRADVDVIYIATPHEAHEQHVVAAAKAGKHVIVEKPIALTLDECDRMIEAVERAGVKFIVGHTASYNPGVRRMRELIVSGEFGRLGMITSLAGTEFLYRPRRPEELDTSKGGGIIYNQVPHQVDAVRLLGGGMLRSVRAATGIWDPKRPTEGSSLAFLEFEDGAAASIYYNGYDRFDPAEFVFWGGRARPKAAEDYGKARRSLANASPEDEIAMRIATGFSGSHDMGGEGGNGVYQSELGVFIAACEGADLRLTPTGVLVYDDNGMREVPAEPSRGVPGRGEVIDEMCEAVLHGRPLIHDGRWGKASLEASLAVLDSSRQRREVYLSHQVPTRD